MVLMALLLLEFLGYAAALSRLAKIPLSLCPALVSSAIVLLLYVADFAGFMRIAMILIHAAGLAAFAREWVWQRKNQWPALWPANNQSSSLFPVVVVGLLLLVFYVGGSDVAFSSWDEFSHWGVVIKAMALTHSFHLPPELLLFPDYPPGSALFIYFALGIMGYSEGHAIFAYALLTVFFLLPLMGFAQRAGWCASIVTAAAAIQWVMMFVGWNSVLIEGHLAVIAAGALMIYLRTRSHHACWLWVALPLAALTLMKQAGQSLALLMGLIVVIDRLINDLCGGAGAGGVNPPWASIRRLLLFVIGACAVPFLIIWSWKWYVIAHNIAPGMGGHTLSTLLAQAADCCRSEREFMVLERYFKRYFDVSAAMPQPKSITDAFAASIAAANWSSVLEGIRDAPKGLLALAFYVVALLLSLLKTSGIGRLRHAVMHSALLAGFVLYSGATLLYYLYGFGDYEGKMLASYARYHNVYLLTWGLVILFEAVECLPTYDWLDGLSARTVVVLLCLVPDPHSYNFLYDFKGRLISMAGAAATGLQGQRRDIRDWVQRIETQLPQPARVYLAWQDSQGYEYLLVKFELLPRITSRSCFSLGTRAAKGDIWKCIVAPEQIASKFSVYDYLLVGHGLQSLAEDYGGLMHGIPAGVDRGLLRIERHSEGLRLEYVIGSHR